MSKLIWFLFRSEIHLLALYSAGDHYPDFKDLFDADKSKK